MPNLSLPFQAVQPPSVQPGVYPASAYISNVQNQALNVDSGENLSSMAHISVVDSNPLKNEIQNTTEAALSNDSTESSGVSG